MRLAIGVIPTLKLEPAAVEATFETLHKLKDYANKTVNFVFNQHSAIYVYVLTCMRIMPIFRSICCIALSFHYKLVWPIVTTIIIF